MKTFHMERISTKPVTIQQEVREVVDIPTVDLRSRPRVEVTNWPDPTNGLVLLNGVLLQGATLRETQTSRRQQWLPEDKTSVVISLPSGTLHLEDVVLTLTGTACPQEVGWKVKADPLDSLLCRMCKDYIAEVSRGMNPAGPACPYHGRPVVVTL